MLNPKGPNANPMNPANRLGGMNSFCIQLIFTRIHLPINNNKEMMPMSTNKVQGVNPSINVFFFFLIISLPKVGNYFESKKSGEEGGTKKAPTEPLELGVFLFVKVAY